MKCLICGRALRSPQSKKLGYGPICYRRAFGKTMKKMKTESVKEVFNSFPSYDIPGQISIEEYLQETV